MVEGGTGAGESAAFVRGGNNLSPKLLDLVASRENLVAAFRECARGKRSKTGYRKFLHGYGERLVAIRDGMLDGTFRWQGYRQFVVKDPKARVITAAPFCDRVVHHALHRVLEPIFDSRMSPATYACRRGRGTGGAVADLWAHLRNVGEQRFVVKLDVASFFASIQHNLLIKSLFRVLPDSSLCPLVESLVRLPCGEFDPPSAEGRGIPIGNLTSQLFANWTLMPLDVFVQGQFPSVRHFRYMDDLVIVGLSKGDALDCAHAAVAFTREVLDLQIPFRKVVPLGCDPVPFLGFLLHHDGYAVLSRNRRRFARHVRILEKRGARESRIAQAMLAHDAWTKLPLR